MEVTNFKLLNKFILTIEKDELPFQNKYGLTDEIGNEILETEYHAIWEVAKNLIGFRYGVEFGLIHGNGKIIIEPCLEGFIEFEYKGKEGCTFIEDILGPSSYEDNYEYIILHQNKTNKPLLINSGGEIISKFEFDWLGHVFTNGNGKVITNGKAGIYNFKNNQFVVKPTYFDDQLYLDNNGEIIYGEWRANKLG